jgi:hypothetical protein
MLGPNANTSLSSISRGRRKSSFNPTDDFQERKLIIQSYIIPNSYSTKNIFYSALVFEIVFKLVKVSVYF